MNNNKKLRNEVLKHTSNNVRAPVKSRFFTNSSKEGTLDLLLGSLATAFPVVCAGFVLDSNWE